MKTLHQKLDALKETLPFLDEVNWKFSADQAHDDSLIDWFIDGGHVRTYTDKSYSGKSFTIWLVKGNVTIMIGTIGKAFTSGRKNIWVHDYCAKFWKKNQNLKMCTNNLLRTPEEIVNRYGVKAIDDKTYAYKDGSIGNIYHLSKDTPKSIVKNEAEVRNLLDSF